MTTVAPNLCQKCFTVTFDHTKCSENGTYAILLQGSTVAADLFAVCQSDGGDICMSTDAAGANQIAIEIVSISTGGSTIELWFPGTINTSTDVAFTVWYGSISGTLAQPAVGASFGARAVWTSVGSMDGVFHLPNGSSLTANDSTSNANNGTITGATATTGKINGGAAFSGTGQFIGMTGMPNYLKTSAFSLSAWIKITTIGAQQVFAARWDVVSHPGWFWNVNAAGQVELYLVNADGSAKRARRGGTVLTGGTTYKLNATYDGSNTAAGIKVYVNGVLETMTLLGDSDPGTLASGTTFLGKYNYSSPSAFTGTIDEYRSEGATSSANRILTDYNIQSATCITVGTVLFSPPFYDATSTTGYQSIPTASANITHVTSTLGSRFLLTEVSLLSAAGTTVSSITYNSVAMTLIGVKTDATNVFRTELWGLIAPATGSNTIAVTMSGSAIWVGSAVSYTNVHQTTPYEGFAGATALNGGSPADATVNITTVAAQDLVVSAVTTNDSSITAGTGTTAKQNATGASGSAGLGIQVPTVSAATVAPDWTNIGAAQIWSIAAVAVRPVSAASVVAGGAGIIGCGCSGDGGNYILCG